MDEVSGKSVFVRKMSLRVPVLQKSYRLLYPMQLSQNHSYNLLGVMPIPLESAAVVFQKLRES